MVIIRSLGDTVANHCGRFGRIGLACLEPLMAHPCRLCHLILTAFANHLSVVIAGLDPAIHFV